MMPKEAFTSSDNFVPPAVEPFIRINLRTLHQAIQKNGHSIELKIEDGPEIVFGIGLKVDEEM